MLIYSRNSKNARVYGLEFGAVRWTGGLMKEVSDRVMKKTVPQLKRMFDDKDISHAVENFRICAGEAEGDFDGSVFCDGDFYKWLEAAVYTAYAEDQSRDRSKFREEIEGYVSLISRAQQPDGYLSTKQILGERDGSAKRNSDINDFEVYNMGHLFTSACLHYRVSGRKDFLEVAKKAAGYLEKLYEESEKSGEVRTAVCPSHYMGLLELYRTTGEERYLRLAKKAIELRDSVKDGLDDNQDRLPLKSHRKIIGHAVRANYLYAGLADLCAEIDDPDYERVLRSVWHDLVTKKLYITGGCGALYNGASPYGNFFHHQLIHQAYGYEYQLPNITAYNETCASVGLVMWAYRMFQIDPQAEYFDILERAWLNVNLASVSLDGLRFFYENMLRRERKLDYELIWPLTRTDYLISYCCPPNIARQLSQSAEYAYETDREGNVWVGLYGENEAVIRDPLKKADQGSRADTDQEPASGESNKKAGDDRIIIRQKTSYPYDGKIIFETESPREFSLYLRIPAWCRSGRIRRGISVAQAVPAAVSGRGNWADTKDENIQTGQLQNMRELKKEELGTYVKVQIAAGVSKTELVLDMPVTLMRANPMIEETTGQLAVMKGPLVYCIESCDVPKEDQENGSESEKTRPLLSRILLDPEAEFSEGELEIDGVPVPTLETVGICLEDGESKDLLSRPLYEAYDPRAVNKREISLRFIPYFAWDNRGEGEMRIWVNAQGSR